jgi:hypothetical protein
MAAVCSNIGIPGFWTDPAGAFAVTVDQITQPAARPLPHPLLSIWTRPGETVRALLENSPTHQLLILAGLAGIVSTLDRAAARSVGDHLSTSTILLIAVVLGPLFGVMTLYIFSVLIAWAGRRINGHADARDLRVAMAWSAVPTIAALAFWVLALLTVGDALFTTAPPEGLDAAVSMLVLSIPMLVLGVWSVVLLAKTVGEVQGFSAWKGLGNVVLGGLVLVVPGVILGIVAAILIPLLAN